jgi:hypothetical protein
MPEGPVRDLPPAPVVYLDSNLLILHAASTALARSTKLLKSASGKTLSRIHGEMPVVGE